jgi:hypothetical protein
VVTWDETKRLANIKVHGLDFLVCAAIWDDFTVAREDVREIYREQRMVVFGRLNRRVGVLVYIERRRGLHIISLRKAEKYEARYYIAEAEDYDG